MKLATLLAIILALSHASASSLRANEPKGSRDLMEKKGKDNKVCRPATTWIRSVRPHISSTSEG